MANDFTAFVPTIWSKKLTLLLDDSGAMMQCVNKDHEGEIKNAGQTVKCRNLGNVTVSTYTTSDITYSDLAPASQDFVVDQRKFFAFKVDDVDKAQSDIEIMNNYLGRAKVAIDLTKDNFLLGKHADVPAGNTIGLEATPIGLTSANIYGYFADLAEKLETANAVGDGKKGWVVINPKVKSLIIKSPEFIHATTLGDSVIRKGAIGEIAGLDVMVSTNFKAIATKYYIMAGTNDAITFGSQVVKVEPIRLQGRFEDAMRGLYVYGAKTLVPNALAKIIATIA